MFNLLQRCMGIDTSPKMEIVEEPRAHKEPDPAICIGQIRGQHEAKVRLLIAAVGMHNCIMVGPPGTGKTLLASTLPPILGPMIPEVHNQLLINYDDLPGEPLPGPLPPFIEVGPATTKSILIGGGRKYPQPGLIARSHGGILFMDELPQFDKEVVESLREPLERGWISITRGGITRIYLCQSMMVAAMNPCMCGYFGFDGDEDSDIYEKENGYETLCTCTIPEIKRYHRKISGPIQDRIDIVIKVPQITAKEQLSDPVPLQSRQFNLIVREATKVRLRRSQLVPNSQIPGHEATSEKYGWNRESLEAYVDLTEIPRFSSRKRSRVAKVARSVSDALFSENVLPSHVEKAFKLVNSNILS